MADDTAQPPQQTGQNGQNGTPWWAKSLSTLFFALGPSTLLLFVFTGIIIGWIDSPLLQARDQAKATQVLLQHHIDEMKRIHEQLRGLQWAVCLNTAKDKPGEERCHRYFSFQSFSDSR